MKPDKPGEWHSRDGRKIVVCKSATFGGLFRWFNQDSMFDSHNMDALEGDDWLPAVAPTFPEMPPKPPQCYVSYLGSDVGWRTFGPSGYVDEPAFYNRYQVVPHPDNDPEAVRMIEEAQKKA